MIRPIACPPADERDLAIITQILHREAGIVIASGKASMVQSRLAKRLRKLGLEDYRSYVALLQSAEGAEERRRMVSALTTNVTQFFRESHHYDLLRSEVLPPLLVAARRGARVRIWSAGSSDGQEAYSAAMVIADLAPDFGNLDLRILATDIDPLMIRRGVEGHYPVADANPVPPPLRARFFTPVSDTGFRIVDPLRRLVTFRELNLHATWPMKGKFDVIFCRNVAIYFDPPSQIKLWQRFRSMLQPDGWLFVGHSERVPLQRVHGFESVGVTAYRASAMQDGGAYGAA